MTDAASAAEMIRKTIVEKIALVDETLAALKSDELTALDTLEGDIETLCEMIGNQPLEVAQTLEDDMARLITKLDMLAAALQEFQNKAEAAAKDQSE